MEWSGTSGGRYAERLQREGERLEVAKRHQGELERVRRERIAVCEKAERLMGLRGIGENAAWLLVQECFGWRPYRDRKQAGSWVGLTGTPFDSGAESPGAGDLEGRQSASARVDDRARLSFGCDTSRAVR